MFSRKIIVLASAALAFLSCSVKEDRDVCPGYFELDLSGIDYSALERYSVDTLYCFLEGRRVPLASFAVSQAPESLWLPVPRGDGRIVLASRPDFSGEGFDCTRSGDFPMLFSGDALFHVDELANGELCLRKNSCLLDISFSRHGEYKLMLQSSVNGILADGTPSEGEYRLGVQADGDGVCRISLPRQSGDGQELILSVSRSGRTSSYFRLGTFMTSLGYDWQKDNLDDWSVKVDYQENVITFLPDNSVNSYVLDIDI